MDNEAEAQHKYETCPKMQKEDRNIASILKKILKYYPAMIIVAC
jgi:hypothetical protein